MEESNLHIYRHTPWQFYHKVIGVLAIRLAIDEQVFKVCEILWWMKNHHISSISEILSRSRHHSDH